MTLKITDDDVAGLAPSAKLVYLVLQEEGELTQLAIRTRTHLHERTLRYALDQLDEIGALEDRPNPRDARQTLYSVK